MKTGRELGKMIRRGKKKKHHSIFCSFHTVSAFKRGKRKISYINGL